MKHSKLYAAIIILIILLMEVLSGCSRINTTPTPLPQPTRDPVLEQTIENQLEAMNSFAVPIYRKATTALDEGDYEISRELYQQVLTLAPNFATAYRRLGYIEAASDNTDLSIELLRKAVQLEPDGYNQSALAMSLIQRATADDIHEAFDLSAAAVKLLPGDDQAVMAWLFSAATLDDIDTVRQADERLLEIAPENAFAHYYAGLLAASDGKWEKAENELKVAQVLGISSETIQELLDSGISRAARIIRIIRWGVIALAAWFIGLLILYFTGSILSKTTMKALNSFQPEVNIQPSPRELKIRSIYRIVVTILSLYFYISIPFVILLLLLVVAGAFYVFAVIELIPLQVAWILVVMVFGSLFAILRSVFSRVKNFPPGRELGRMDVPELWKLVQDVARRLSVQPVDTIFLTPDAAIGVFEKGSILKKLRGVGKRNLLLGMGALPGLTQGQFASILAHEYGHFSNRDTAGGDLAHQVYASLSQMALRMVQTRAAQFYNPVWLFIVGYQRIFLQVTLGASRLQEILADRYAAVAYGSENFIDGLKNLIRQSILFPLLANREIQSAVELNRTFVNLYDLPMQDDLKGKLYDKVDEAMTRPTSKYDSHPAPRERISLIEQLHIPYSPMHDNPRPMLELFPNPEQLEQEMTAEIRKRLRK